MTLLQPKLSLKVAQRQILTPGLMQMVSVLALNKLELREMIQSEMAENPVLDEIEESVPLLDDVEGRQAERERPAEEVTASVETPKEEKDPFAEIDFGSYFQDYLDPGFRTPNSFELSEKPSFENFLSQPDTLTDHLCWQLGSLSIAPALREAAEYIVGNLNEDGYLLATDEELLAGFALEQDSAAMREVARTLLVEALALVRSLDPSGIATRDLRECLSLQVRQQEHEFDLIFGEADAAIEDEADVVVRRTLFRTAMHIIDECLPLLQKRDLTALARAVSKPPEHVQQAVDLIRALDPRPGQRYNRTEARLIEPDVVFVKRGDEFVVVMNEEDMPTLRLNQGYRKLLAQSNTEREVKEYVKERYRSALQLIRNIEQRKSTILRTCEAIVRRQPEFLERGVDALRPMMIKDVAEEIGVHPSTVSRAVSNKYVHTPQGVFELRFFFSEAAGGPEGAGTPLMLLKRKVKKLIDEEDPKKPLTDDFIASVLQSQGIQVTRRTVAKYREDMRIPSTHQRRVRI
ncbi:MAG TPA: RNA polymerase factor sigma-54 [Acidobacteriaceae bacterium]|jgi:RNA polymerase sigma-54 factor